MDRLFFSIYPLVSASLERLSAVCTARYLYRRHALAPDDVTIYNRQCKVASDKITVGKKYFLEYFSALEHFKQIDEKWKNGSQELESIRKERFLHLRFCWELAKTATEVTVPPEFYSPPYKRVNDRENHPDYCDQWRLEPVAPQKIAINIKNSYHHNTYANGEEMSLGLIALLPFAVYFPGRPKEAFHYIRDNAFRSGCAGGICGRQS